MNKTLYIIRGLPGSGKSTLAEILAPNANFSADQFFTNSAGEYCFNAKSLGSAHRFCQDRVRNAMRGLVKTIVLHNTCTLRSEFEPYMKLCETFGYTPFVLTCENSFGNVHEVPRQTIQNMRERWEGYNETQKFRT